MTKAQTHISKRKRIHQKNEKYPHPNKWVKFLDKTVYVTGILVSIMTIPQAYTIWSNKTAAGVSLITWVFYLIAAVILTVYGFVHKEKPIILTYILQGIIEIVIIVGIIIYG